MIYDKGVRARQTDTCRKAQQAERGGRNKKVKPSPKTQILIDSNSLALTNLEPNLLPVWGKRQTTLQPLDRSDTLDLIY